MRARHPENPNLHLHYLDSLNELPVMSECSPMVKEYLDRLYSAFQHALADYKRIFVFRVDPVLPTEVNERMTAEDHKNLVEDFLKSFQSIIKCDYQRKRKFGWVPETKVRHAWCRETYQDGKLHYHFVFILNQAAYNTVGNPCSPHENVANRISRAWHSALGLEWDQSRPLIHLPANSQYWINGHNGEGLPEAFYRCSYLCKSKSKRYGDGMRSFGSSRS